MFEPTWHIFLGIGIPSEWACYSCDDYRRKSGLGRKPWQKDGRLTCHGLVVEASHFLKFRNGVSTKPTVQATAMSIRKDPWKALSKQQPSTTFLGLVHHLYMCLNMLESCWPVWAHCRDSRPRQNWTLQQIWRKPWRTSSLRCSSAAWDFAAAAAG